MSQVPPRRITSLTGISQQTIRTLTVNGYESLRDLQSVTEELLAHDLKIPAPDIERIMALIGKPSTPFLFSRTQSAAASLAKDQTSFTTRFPPIDKLLDGGLPRGCVLELSGPPGTFKERIARNITLSFLEARERILWIEFSNMTSAFSLCHQFERSTRVPPNFEELVMHVHAHTLTESMTLIHQLPSLITTHGKVSLLVLSSIHAPFQPTSGFSTSAKQTLLQKIKHVLALLTSKENLTVVSTSQLSTKLQSADGSAATFESGGRGIIVPQLGASYLPTGRAYRVIIAPIDRHSGFVRLLSSPRKTSEQVTAEPYQLAALM